MTLKIHDFRGRIKYIRKRIANEMFREFAPNGGLKEWMSAKSWPNWGTKDSSSKRRFSAWSGWHAGAASGGVDRRLGWRRLAPNAAGDHPGARARPPPPPP